VSGYSTSEVILLEYHTIDGKGTIETRRLFEDYNLIGTPSVVFNGQRGEGVIMGARTVAVYQARIDQLKEKTSTMAMTAMMSASGTMSAIIDITNLSEAGLGNARLYAVVYEDLNTGENHYVVRDVLPVQTVTLSGHGTASFEVKTDMSYTSCRHMAVILKSTSGQILQSRFVI
jgi:hypothetical protein